MSAVAKMETGQQVATQSVMTPMEMLDRALSSGAGPETLEKLMALQERWEASQARKAFDEAIAAAKAQIPPITRSAKGHNDKKYADFAAIASVVDPILSQHGLSYRFRSKQDERINVTCILSHRGGHSEETTLSGPADTTGNKNAVQAIGSTLTYLQRYSLVQALGLAAAHDDDGNGEEKISEKQVTNLIDALEAKSASRDKFLKWAKVSRFEDIPAAYYQSCLDAINKAGK
jgi:hypothetical protein